MLSKLITNKTLILLLLTSVLLLAACSPQAPEQSLPDIDGAVIQYTLRTGSEGGSYVFFGVGGEIDGQTNPDLQASVGDTVMITLVNDDGVFHDVEISEFGAATPVFGEVSREETVQFVVDQAGTFSYFCSVAGHRAAGMEGQLIVSPGE